MKELREPGHESNPRLGVASPFYLAKGAGLALSLFLSGAVFLMGQEILPYQEHQRRRTLEEPPLILYEEAAQIPQVPLEEPPQTEKPPWMLDGEAVWFPTSDGWELVGQFSPPEEGNLTFILVHMLGGTRHNWNRLAKALAFNGYGWFAFDLRGHGESLMSPQGSTATWTRFQHKGEDTEFNQMSLDVDAAYDFLLSTGVAESSVAVCGAGIGANVALKWAAVIPEISLAILLSPGIEYKGVRSVTAMTVYGDRPVLFIAGERDRTSHLATNILYNIAKQYSGEENANIIDVSGRHGTEMLNFGLVKKILDWIGDPMRSFEEVAISTAAAAVEESTVTYPTFFIGDPFE